MNAKIFELKILQNKDPRLHPDVTKPQIATKPDINGNKGKYFHIGVNAPLATKNNVPVPQQTRAITFTIFENGNRSEIYKLLEETLLDPSKIDIATNGSFAKIHPSVLGFEGDLQVRELDFAYTMEDSTGKTIIDPITKSPRLRRSIQAFIFANEDETGLSELILATEERRARTRMVQTEEDKGTTTVNE